MSHVIAEAVLAMLHVVVDFMLARMRKMQKNLCGPGTLRSVAVMQRIC